MENKKKVAISEADVAYQILREHKAPMHYRELITAVLEHLGRDTTITGSMLAQIHTEINLDSRFDFLGKGMWGLQIWAPKPANRMVASEPNERSYQPKAIDYMWDEEEEEDIDDEDVEDGFIPVDEDMSDEDMDEPESADDDDTEGLVIDDLADDEVDLEEIDEEDDEPELA